MVIIKRGEAKFQLTTSTDIIEGGEQYVILHRIDSMCVIQNMKRYPAIDLSSCSDCRGCIEIAPDVFRYNFAMGMMEVIEVGTYPEELVDEAIKNCPKDCIYWDDGF